MLEILIPMTALRSHSSSFTLAVYQSCPKVKPIKRNYLDPVLEYNIRDTEVSCHDDKNLYIIQHLTILENSTWIKPQKTTVEWDQECLIMEYGLEVVPLASFRVGRPCNANILLSRTVAKWSRPKGDMNMSMALLGTWASGRLHDTQYCYAWILPYSF